MDETKLDRAEVLFYRFSYNDDEEAFKDLFYDFFASLCIFANRFIDDEDECQDVVQDFFFHLWKNRKSIKIHSSVRNFFMTSVRNACLDVLRKKEVEQKWNKKCLEENQDEDIYDLYTTTELELLLNKALDKLPEKLSSTFRMNRFEGKTYAEIADEKQISIKTVEAYMSKTLKHLKEELKDFLVLLIIFSIK